MRWFFVQICRLLLRIFFRSVEVIGQDRIPSQGLLLFALNHHNALIDPLFLICLKDRKVSFLTKEPLFRMPVVGWFVRAFESVPVYRAQDGADPQKNRAMLDAARQLLKQGNAIALFPEGTSHSDPHLRPLRTGAARLALSTQALSNEAVYVVPAAIAYEEKHTFRSRAVLNFGPALTVPFVALDAHNEPSRDVTFALTEQIQLGILALLPTANTHEGLVLGEVAERILSVAVLDAPEHCQSAVELIATVAHPASSPNLAHRMARRTQLIDAYQRLTAAHPTHVSSLVARISQFNARLDDLGLPVDVTSVKNVPSARRRMFWLWGLWLLLLAPGALLGFLAFSPAYYAVRFISTRYSGDETDVVATVKLLAGMLLFPFSWALLVGSCAWLGGPTAAYAFSLLLLIAAVAALGFWDVLGAFSHHRRVFMPPHALPEGFAELRVQRARLAEEMARFLVAIPDKGRGLASLEN